MKSVTVGLTVIAITASTYIIVELFRNTYHSSRRDKKRTFWSRLIGRSSGIPYAAFRVSLDPSLIKNQVKCGSVFLVKEKVFKCFLRYVSKILVPSWHNLDDKELRVERVLGGITNRIFCVSVNKDMPNLQFQKVLVRVFGAEGIIDREKENMIFEQLALNQIAPNFIGEFANGRIEHWLEARCICINGNFFFSENFFSISFLKK